MDTMILNKLGQQYKNYVNNILHSNVKYRGFNDVVQWHFNYNDDISISATTDRKTNIISINYKWFIDCFKNERNYEIEYFLIHETRHIYQHLIIVVIYFVSFIIKLGNV